MDDAAALMQRVAASVRPLVDACTPTPDELAYLDFYGINFSREFAGLEHTLGSIESCGEQLVVQVLRQPQAAQVMLLVHGYLDHIGLYGHMIRYALERGYSVVAFDLPGHGLSSGERVVIDDFSDYCHAIENVRMQCSFLPGRWRVIAQSTGGAAVLEYMLRHPQDFDRVVMLAPLVRPVGWWWVRPAQFVLIRFRDHVTREFAENSGDPEFLRWIRTDPLQADVLSLRWMGALRRWIKKLPAGASDTRVPLLLIQGDADGTVDWRYNVKRIQQLVPTARLDIIAGGRHHLANESVPIRMRMNELMDEFFA
jgi:alpha-beta hydrolase superfamily lysophospholipase